MKWFWHQASAGLNTTPGLKNHRKNLSLLGCAFYFLGNWLRDKVWKCKNINYDNKYNYILLLLLVLLLLLIITIIVTIVITILITIVITIMIAYYYFYSYYCYYYYYYLLLLLLLSLSLLSLSLLLSLLLLSLSLLLLLYTIIIISIYLYCDSYYYYSYDYHHCYHYYSSWLSSYLFIPVYVYVCSNHNLQQIRPLPGHQISGHLVPLCGSTQELLCDGRGRGLRLAWPKKLDLGEFQEAGIWMGCEMGWHVMATGMFN